MKWIFKTYTGEIIDECKYAFQAALPRINEFWTTKDGREYQIIKIVWNVNVPSDERVVIFTVA